ncbi:MAG: PQQ-binding-like beta-propeller repeat protein, partial [Treponema porcinum]|uniref:outer membrane protein assembly factor BamB family protein n=1 Tax=Treponema porcinum TaxID=261392 RepID=UPI002356163F
VQTSYGFVVLTDGKMISACTENGTKLWEKPVPGRPDPFLTVISKDFLVTVSDKKTISLINPSGVVLWSKKLPYQVTESALPGKDARFFVKGKKNISCFGINGVCKWSIETPPLSSIPLVTLNDGTVLAVLLNSENGKSSGIRISPFGTVLETIRFAGIVSGAMTCDYGVLLAFSSGGFGLCAVNEKEKLTGTKWAVPSNDYAFQSASPSKGTEFVPVSQSLSALLLSSSGKSVKVILFENRTGKIVNIFYADGMDFLRLSGAAGASGGEGIFLSDDRTGRVYDTAGNIVWSAELPSASSRAGNWNCLSYTKNNVIVICSKSWVMNGFRTVQRLSGKKNVSSVQKKSGNPVRYENFYNIDTAQFSMYFSESLGEDILGKNRISVLQKGMYGPDEINFSSKIFSVCKAYSQFLSSASSGARPEEKPLFYRDTIGLQEAVMQLSLLGTDEVPELIASLIQTEKNMQNLAFLMKAAGQCANDPDGRMLRAIEKRLLTLPPRNTTVLVALSDAAYEICRFMGRPAFFSHCMEIQKSLLSSQYDNTVHEAVRKNLSKTAALNM